MIGHSSGSENTIRINRASYIVEIMAFDEDRPVKEGEEGRIVVTDLYSHAMPLIRYEIGDTAVLVSKAGFGAEDIENPQGRIIETIFATNGSRISWAIIYDYMIAEPNIIQYQFQQTGKRNYQLLLITSDKYSRNSREVLSRKFLNLLGDDAVLDFRYTDLIPALTSGKRPMIINSYTKNNPG